MMPNAGEYMNILTRKIKDKGYSLPEFCDKNLISLRTYRRWEKPDHVSHEKLKQMIEDDSND